MSRLAKPVASAPVAAHLRPEGLKFLRGIARNNDRDWFQPRKATFDAELKEPMLAIIRKVTDAMADFAPDFVRPAEKCLFRIYRDTRFSNNKLPYKTHVAAWWTPHGLEKTSGAGFYFHISAKEVVVAAGAYMPEKDQLAAIRHWLLENHAEFRKVLQTAAVRKAFAGFEGNALVRASQRLPGRASGDGPDQMPPVGTEHHAAGRDRPRSELCRPADSPLPAGRAGGRCPQHPLRGCA